VAGCLVLRRIEADSGEPVGELRRAGYLRQVEAWWRGPLVVAPTEQGRAVRPDLCLAAAELPDSTRLTVAE
jgi:hypothetical protein